MTTSDPTGGDKVVYFGVININENSNTIGSVDVWRSLLTKEMFCEEKRLGIEEIVDYIGMPKIDKDKKWAVAISRNRKGHLRWRLVKLVKEGKSFEHMFYPQESHGFIRDQTWIDALRRTTEWFDRYLK